MKIYFAGSIRGGNNEASMYMKIINYLKEYGDVLTEHIGDSDLKDIGEQDKSDEYIFSRDLAWLRSADIIVSEVTSPSLGVGYEIGISETLNKPILCLFYKQENKHLSAMLRGNKKVRCYDYTTFEEVKNYIDQFMHEYKLS